MNTVTPRSQPRHRSRAIPLHKLDQESIPFNGRALAWSPDAELASATNDSVYVYVPQFIGANGDRIPIQDEAENEDDNTVDIGEEEEREEEGEADSGPHNEFATGTETRKQFAAAVRRIPVGSPRLDSRVNQPLFDDQSPGGSGGDRGLWQAASSKIGAGSGQLTGVGSTMNSVVSIAWSPSGVGRNGRSVLGVLTASGMLIIYGEALDGVDGETKQAGGKSTTRGRSSYDTSRWEVLWAVGERMAVRGQTGPAECIVSFAWSGGCDVPNEEGRPGSGDSPTRISKALLIYCTEKNEMVVLNVCHLRHSNGSAGWHVSEANRFKAPGPHDTPQPPPSTGAYTHLAADPTFVPSGTPFGVQCSSWLAEKVSMGPGRTPETILTCLIGYLAPHYVGFRRMTVTWRPDVGQGQQEIRIDKHDVAGHCMFLSANAMLEFEDGIWTLDDDTETDEGEHKKSMCRALVATPMAVKGFKVEFAAHDPNDASSTESPGATHNIGENLCGATPPEAKDWHTNPITGLVIHPPDPTNCGDQPLYSLVRQSAPTKSKDWHATNAPDEAGDPGWAVDIELRLACGYNHDHDDVDWEGDPRITETKPGPMLFQPGKTEFRVRLWGLAQAPGGLPGSGGITAVLETETPVNGDRGGRSRDRSHVLFGYQGEPASIPVDMTTSTATTAYYRPPVSTEARLWAYMYGDGPPVTSKAAAVQNQQPGTAALQDLVAHQVCSLCGEAVDGHVGTSTPTSLVCKNNHVFDRCSATGLAIQRPNVSQACGVCGSRTLLPNALEEMLEVAGSISIDSLGLHSNVLGKVCGRCGGKFYE